MLVFRWEGIGKVLTQRGRIVEDDLLWTALSTPMGTVPVTGSPVPSARAWFAGGKGLLGGLACTSPEAEKPDGSGRPGCAGAVVRTAGTADRFPEGGRPSEPWPRTPWCGGASAEPGGLRLRLAVRRPALDFPHGTPKPLADQSGVDFHDAQSKVLVTAFCHCRYSFSRRSVGIFGSHCLSLAQLDRMSCSLLQNPTARPAA